MILCKLQSSSAKRSVKIASSVSTIDAYVHLLKTNKTVSPCDYALRVFVVQDFSVKD